MESGPFETETDIYHFQLFFMKLLLKDVRFTMKIIIRFDQDTGF